MVNLYRAKNEVIQIKHNSVSLSVYSILIRLNIFCGYGGHYDYRVDFSMRVQNVIAVKELYGI